MQDPELPAADDGCTCHLQPVHSAGVGERDKASRGYQLRYSESEPLMSDEVSRRQKARKIIAVLRHALAGSTAGMRVLDIGSSTGIILAAVGEAFGTVVGIDIDDAAARTASKYLVRPNQTVVLGDAMRLPVANASTDVVILNHVYEHVPDARVLLDETWRVLRAGGIVYFAADNRHTLIEPHHRLPLLSWLPRRFANAYLRLTRRGDEYYEQLLSYRHLRRLVARFDVDDYTFDLIRGPALFSNDEMVRPGSLIARLPRWALRLLRFLIPTFIFVLRKGAAPADQSSS